jgi:hypothetical protein
MPVQWRFLLRAVAFLALMLALWWMVLLDPLLEGLRVSAEAVIPGSHVAIGADRNWTFRVPAPAALVEQLRAQKMIGDTAGVQYRFIRLMAPGRYPILFTVSLPLYWAILLAAPGQRRLMRMVAGSAMLAVIALLSIAVYALQLAGGAMQLTSSGVSKAMVESATYLAEGVVPYLAPVLTALWLNPELRGMVLASAAGVDEPPCHNVDSQQCPKPKTTRARRRRGGSSGS